MRVIAWLLGLFVFSCLLALGGAIYAYPRLPIYLSQYLSDKFDVPVKIDDITLTLDSINIHGIDIANPKPSKLPTAIKVKTLSLKAPLINYLKNDILIKEALLDNVYASVEFYDKSNTYGNWTQLIAKFDSNASFGRSEGRQVDQEPSGETVTIKKLVLMNIQIDIALYNKLVKHLSPIDKLTFDDVGTEQGFPIEEITEIIIHKLMGHIFSLEGLGNMFKSIIETPVGILKGIFGG